MPEPPPIPPQQHSTHFHNSDYHMLDLHEYDRVSLLAFACLISRHHLLVSWYE